MHIRIKDAKKLRFFLVHQMDANILKLSFSHFENAVGFEKNYAIFRPVQKETQTQ